MMPLKPEQFDELRNWPLQLVDIVFVEEWRLIRTPAGRVHLVGRFSPGGRLKASLPLAALNLSSRSVVTLTGKKLRLQGEPGCTAIGKCIASMYGIFDRRMLEAQDVTDAYVSLTAE
ncbi:hypothetical protein Rmet_5462 (plasmid) [Cupriavidus metallidurans CH34]|uniref:Uncharacterized protein n=2 Tax=Cupriavidus metallidurans TaxID=119219 RepID=Q1LC05_CUPMC|nr:hypothetical protein Rmet_5462 [Cupriavidus metallidurans CH34]